MCFSQKSKSFFYDFTFFFAVKMLRQWQLNMWPCSGVLYIIKLFFLWDLTLSTEAPHSWTKSGWVRREEKVSRKSDSSSLCECDTVHPQPLNPAQLARLLAKDESPKIPFVFLAFPFVLVGHIKDIYSLLVVMQCSNFFLFTLNPSPTPPPHCRYSAIKFNSRHVRREQSQIIVAIQFTWNFFFFFPKIEEGGAHLDHWPLCNDRTMFVGISEENVWMVLCLMFSMLALLFSFFCSVYTWPAWVINHKEAWSEAMTGHWVCANNRKKIFHKEVACNKHLCTDFCYLKICLIVLLHKQNKDL